jgi:xanthine dehydrogenase accessory factor
MTPSLDISVNNNRDGNPFRLCPSGTAPLSNAALTDELPLLQKALSTDTAFDVFEFAIDARQVGNMVALCTLVEIRGGSARPLGSHMVVANDGRYCGYVSGGCTEAAIAAEALQAIATGHDRFVLLGEGSPFFDIVLPCGGGITVAIHVVRDIEPICSVIEHMKHRKDAQLSYHPGRQHLSLGSTRSETGWNGDEFVTCYRPAVRVLLSGRTLEVETAAKIAQAAGYEVVLYDKAGFDASLIDVDTAVALLQHDLELELPVLEASLEGKPFYIGALGSARTHEKRVQLLRERGHSIETIDRIKAPIGLFGRARDAQSLALSVIADIAACRQSAPMPT